MLYNKKTLKTGYYHVVNKEKLRNEKKSLYYRSGLEKRMMEIADHSKNILEWSYEDIIIPYQKYQNAGTNKKNYYVIDFWIKKKIDNVIKEYLIEIKPYNFLFPPEPQKRQTKQWLEKLENYTTISQKCKFAKIYAEQHNMEFCILTEKDLY